MYDSLLYLSNIKTTKGYLMRAPQDRLNRKVSHQPTRFEGFIVGRVCESERECAGPPAYRR